MDWQLVSYIFGLIFIAELPDKTALACLVLGSKYKPWPVFAGAALAFFVQNVIAVACGSLLAQLPQTILHRGVGIAFVIFGLIMFLKKESARIREPAAAPFFKIASISFTTIFMMELGDFTQLATAAFAARFNMPMTVLAASTLALWSVAALAIFSGNETKSYVNNPNIRKLAAAIFVLAGAVFIFTSY